MAEKAAERPGISEHRYELIENERTDGVEEQGSPGITLSSEVLYITSQIMQ
jgi:hypothetical protein